MTDKRKQAYELAEHATDMELASMASVVLALPHVHESSTLYHESCDLLIDICNHNNKHIADTAKGIMQRLHDAYNNNQ
jgi:hypothetical protein